MVLSPALALTAGHCVDAEPLAVEGAAVQAYPLGRDLAWLEGRFPPPYAHASVAWTPPLAIEGFGCAPAYRRGVGPLALSRQPDPGTELRFVGRVCHGDSGGAIWNAHGELIGIVTALGVADPQYGYGTELPGAAP